MNAHNVDCNSRIYDMLHKHNSIKIVFLQSQKTFVIQFRIDSIKNDPRKDISRSLKYLLCFVKLELNILNLYSKNYIDLLCKLFGS